MSWLLDPWVWLGAGLALMLLELAVPGYVMLSFSLGAFGMAGGLLFWRLGLGMVLPDPEGSAAALLVLLIWALLSGIAAWVIWRFWRGRSRGPDEGEDVNEFENRL